MISADHEPILLSSPHVDHTVLLVSDNQSDEFADVTPVEVSATFSATEQEEEMPVVSESNVFTTDEPLQGQSSTESAATLPRVSATGEDHTSDVSWDPLQSPTKADASDAETTLKGGLLEGIEEEIAPANMNGRLEHIVEATPNASKRASHHRLDLKLSSPPPWELIDPPSDGGRKEANGFYTGYDSRKDNPMDNSTYAFVLLQVYLSYIYDL